jgi:succinate-semialdehyde dehydrogenase
MRKESVSINPYSGAIIGTYPVMTATELQEALRLTHSAFGQWKLHSIGARASRMADLAQVLLERRQNLASMIAREMGKPVASALAEIDKCAKLCNWYSENLERLLADEVSDFGIEGVATVRYLPLGVVLGVMPWNFPVWQVLRAAVPIMAAGNAFILKHADNVQGSAHALADCFAAAGFPRNVFTVVNADRADITALLGDPRVCGVSVTAGVAAGAALAAEAGRNLKKSLLELGGSDPFIVLADADLELAVAAAVTARFQNCGQVCIAAKRFIVDKAVADVFKEKFVARASAIKMGDPEDASTEMGPMARERLRAEVHGLVERSVALGARVVLGGEIPDGPGTFYPPTVLVDVTNYMPICREETFGPVAPILIADDLDHAVHLANDSDFGLSASIWTRNIEAARDLAPRLETGAVFVNQISASDPRVPIGGIKQSGYGRELSHFGLREFCNAQLHWDRQI